MRSRLGILICLLGLAALLTACQGGDSTPTATPMQWQRVTFVASRLQPGFSLNIPADWNYEVTDTGIIVFNYPRLLDLPDDGAAMPEGSIVANLKMLSTFDAQMIGARNAAGILDAVVGASSSRAVGPQYSSANVLEIRGRDAVQASVSIGNRDSLLIALDLRGNFVLAVIVAPKGELERQSELLNQVFDSLELRLAQ